jgi:hypothetical protein
VAGEVVIADRGYARAKELRACLDPSGAGSRDFIVRIGWQALALRDAEGKPFNLITHLAKLRPDAGPQEWAVQAVVGPGKQASLWPIRLIALPLPPDKVEVRRGKHKRRASRRQEALDPRSVLGRRVHGAGDFAAGRAAGRARRHRSACRTAPAPSPNRGKPHASGCHRPHTGSHGRGVR